MTTLFDITLLVARQITKIVERAATGGSTTTLVDTIGLTQADGHWDAGTLWLKELGAVAEVSGFAANTLTFTPTLLAAVVATDLYAVASNEWPYTELVKAVNMALQKVGPVKRRDVTTLVVSTVGRYELPIGVENVCKVKVFDPTDETSFYWSERWEEEWDEETGAYVGYLVFDSGAHPKSDGWYIEIQYLGKHLPVVLAEDIISPAIDTEYLMWLSIVELYKGFGLQTYGEDSRRIPQFLEEAMQHVQDMRGTRRTMSAPVLRVHVAGS